MRRWYFAASRISARPPRKVANKALPCRIRILDLFNCWLGTLTQPRSENVQHRRFLPLAIFARNVGGSIGRFRWDAIADRHTRVLPSCGGRAGRLPDGMRLVAAMVSVGVEVGAWR